MKGETVDQYVVDRKLGAGGIADVYLVTHALLGSKHAMKVLDRPDPAIRERAMAEGRVQAGIKHPFLVMVTDTFDLHDGLALVMQHVDGPDLGGWLNTEPTFDERMDVFLRIVDGVEFAHNQGFVHRDLKPDNILMEDTADGWIPRIIDFGLVKVMEEVQKLGNTNPGAMMGTPAFMAPEQVNDAGSVDQNADMWALGAILYRMVCGVNPFPTGTVLETLNAVLRGQYVAVKEHVPTIDPAIADAVHGLLRPSRAERIPDCVTLRAVLGMTAGAEVTAAPWRGCGDSRHREDTGTWPGLTERDSDPADKAPSEGEATPPRAIPLPAVLGAVGIGVVLVGAIIWALK